MRSRSRSSLSRRDNSGLALALGVYMFSASESAVCLARVWHVFYNSESVHLVYLDLESVDRPTTVWLQCGSRHDRRHEVYSGAHGKWIGVTLSHSISLLVYNEDSHVPDDVQRPLSRLVSSDVFRIDMKATLSSDLLQLALVLMRCHAWW